MMKSFPVLVLLSLKLRVLETAPVEVMDSQFFGKAYEIAEYPVFGEENSAANIPCVPVQSILTSSITNKPKIEWVDPHTGTAITNLRMKTLPAGDLQDTNCKIEDSGVYQCNLITEGDVMKVEYRHTLIVYTIPAYRRTVEYVYISKVCDETLIARLMKEARAILCSDLGDACGFQVEEPLCEMHRSEAYLRLRITLHAASIFKAPKCSPSCVKEGFEQNLQRFEIQDKLELLQRSSEETFQELTGFKFDTTRTSEVIYPLCPDGYVIFRDIVCVPCMHGYYKHKDDNTTCKQCGIWAYQPKFASTFCIRCPGMGHSDFVTSPSQKLCKPFWKTWQGILVVSISVVVLLVICFLILLHLGAFPCIYKTEAQRNKAKEEKDEKEVEDLMEYYDKEKEGKDPAEEPEEEEETLLDRTKKGTGHKRWYPGLGWM